MDLCDQFLFFLLKLAQYLQTNYYILFRQKSPIIMDNSWGEGLTFGFPFNKGANKLPGLLEVVLMLWKLQGIVVFLAFTLQMWENICIMLVFPNFCESLVK